MHRAKEELHVIHEFVFASRSDTHSKKSDNGEEAPALALAY